MSFSPPTSVYTFDLFCLLLDIIFWLGEYRLEKYAEGRHPSSSALSSALSTAGVLITVTGPHHEQLHSRV